MFSNRDDTKGIFSITEVNVFPTSNLFFEMVMGIVTTFHLTKFKGQRQVSIVTTRTSQPESYGRPNQNTTRVDKKTEDYRNNSNA